MAVHHFDLGSHSRHSLTLHTIHFRCAGRQEARDSMALARVNRRGFGKLRAVCRLFVRGSFWVKFR